MFIHISMPGSKLQFYLNSGLVIGFRLTKTLIRCRPFAIPTVLGNLETSSIASKYLNLYSSYNLHG